MCVCVDGGHRASWGGWAGREPQSAHRQKGSWVLRRMAKAWLPPHTEVHWLSPVSSTILTLLTDKDREAQRGKRPHATPSTSHLSQWLGRAGKPVCMGPWALSTAAASSDTSAPWGCFREDGRHSPELGHRGLWPATDASADRLQSVRGARRAECPTRTVPCFSITSITVPIRVPRP